jgi:hypothetical protein
MSAGNGILFHLYDKSGIGDPQTGIAESRDALDRT